MLLVIVLVPLALVLLVVSALGFAGLGPMTDDRRSARSGMVGTIGPAVGMLAGLGLLAGAVVGTVMIVGLDDAEEEPDRERAERPVVATTTTTTTRAPDVATTRAAGDSSDSPDPTVARLGPRILVEATDSTSFPTSYPVVDRLRSGTVLQVRARGFEPDVGGIAQQCARSDGVRWCFNPIPVQFDADGAAEFQYLVAAAASDGREVAGGCRAGASPCTLVVRTADGEVRGEIETVFGDELPPPGRIAVSQATDLSLDGAPVIVAVRDYPPGATVTAMLCAAPDPMGLRCGAPGPTTTLHVARDGTGRARLVVTPGPVGAAGAPCGRGDECGISVVSADGVARAPVVPVTFAAPPGADYDPTRVALGLAIAAVLLALAGWLILRTDWSAVGEAAAPEIDDAEYADLDAIIAALPPEEDELVTTS